MYVVNDTQRDTVANNVQTLLVKYFGQQTNLQTLNSLFRSKSSQLFFTSALCMKGMFLLYLAVIYVTNDIPLGNNQQISLVYDKFTIYTMSSLN